MQSLAIKYRPSTWDGVCEQSSIKAILTNQLREHETKNAYLFCGPAGCGKTTCARIFANNLNQGKGNPIELDAASHNGVDDVREINNQARTQSLDSEYKVFIIDECHSLSNNACQAMLKLIEEPPAKAVFIFCTTDPQKIPRTILSRVQRYDFQRISLRGIYDRLLSVMQVEGYNVTEDTEQALMYIAKQSFGGMRDALTALDKCLALTSNLTVQTVVEALGVVDYNVLYDFWFAYVVGDTKKLLEIVSTAYYGGKDLKQFVKSAVQFFIDVCKYDLTKDWLLIGLPQTKLLEDCEPYDFEQAKKLLEVFMRLNAEIKYSANPLYDVEGAILLL